MSADIYADRTHDDNGEPLCNLPARAMPVSIPRASVPIFNLSNEALVECRAAASRELAREYAHHILR